MKPPEHATQRPRQLWALSSEASDMADRESRGSEHGNSSTLSLVLTSPGLPG